MFLHRVRLRVVIHFGRIAINRALGGPAAASHSYSQRRRLGRRSDISKDCGGPFNTNCHVQHTHSVRVLGVGWVENIYLQPLHDSPTTELRSCLRIWAIFDDCVRRWNLADTPLRVHGRWPPFLDSARNNLFSQITQVLLMTSMLPSLHSLCMTGFTRQQVGWRMIPASRRTCAYTRASTGTFRCSYG